MSPRSTRRYLCAAALPLLAPAAHPTPQKCSSIHPAECKAPLWSRQSPLGACKLQQSGVGARSFLSKRVQHALHLSNPQWGPCSPLQLPHNALKPECWGLIRQTGQLGQFNYFQGWNPFGGMYKGTWFKFVTLHNCCYISWVKTITSVASLMKRVHKLKHSLQSFNH